MSSSLMRGPRASLLLDIWLELGSMSSSSRSCTIIGGKPTAWNIRAGLCGSRTEIENLFVGGHCAEYGGGVPLAFNAAANASLLVLQSFELAAANELATVMDGLWSAILPAFGAYWLLALMRSSKLYLLLLLILLSGCDDRSALRWELRFSSNSDQEAAVVIETDILEGGCEGVPRGASSLLYTDAPNEPAREVLDPMQYGFRALAFDANCALIAAGCEEAILPGPEVVITLLTSVDGEPECLPELCSLGVCDEQLPDGGPGDADIDQPDSEADADADTGDADSDVDDVVDGDADSDDVVDADPDPELMTCVYRADSADTTQELHCRNVDGNSDCYTSSWPPCSSVPHPEYTIPSLPPRADIISATLRYDCDDCDHPGEEGVVRVNSGSYSMPADDGWDDVWTNEITIDVTGSVEEGRNSVVFGPADSDCTYFVVRGVELVVEAWLYGCP